MATKEKIPQRSGTEKVPTALSLFGGNAPDVVEGFITDVVSGPRFYKVDTVGGFKITCRDLTADSGIHPLGPKKIGVYQVGTRVLVAKHPTNRVGYIIGGTPFLGDERKANTPDPIAPFTATDGMNDVCHYYPLKMDFAGGVHDYNSSRPWDAVPGSDSGEVNDLGVGYGVSRFFSWMRASEVCGMWFFYYDNLARMSTYNLEHWTSGGEYWLKDDQGEVDEVKLFTPYPWEALGLIGRGPPSMKINELGGWFYPGQKKNWYEPVEDDQVGIPRIFDVGGYLGDTEKKYNVVPEEDKVTSPHKLSAEDLYTGVSDVQRHVDGLLSFRSARGLHFEKYIFIPVPKQVKYPEEQKELGDSPDNYKHAGLEGNGPDHVKVEYDFEVGAAGGGEGIADKALAWSAQMWDYHAYMYNYYGVVPFVYHKNDWFFPEEGEEKVGQEENLGMYIEDMGDSHLLPVPEFATMKIDHRLESNRYYFSRSFINMMPDGSIIIGDGYLSSIKMTGGSIFIDCPGDIWMKPGRSVSVWAPDDINLRAGTSVDITANQRDVRVKAERNLHMLGGNNGDSGGVLIEAKTEQEGPFTFGQNVGENVQSSGIVLKAEKSQIMGYAHNVYMRSLDEGYIMLDADAGAGTRIDVGESVLRFAQAIFSDYVGVNPSEDAVPSLDEAAVNIFTKDVLTLGPDRVLHVSAVNTVYARTDEDCNIGLDGILQVGKQIVAEEEIFTNDSIFSKGDMICEGNQLAAAHANLNGSVGTLLEPIDLGPPLEIKDPLEENAATLEAFKENNLEQSTAFRSSIYGEGLVGNEEFIGDLGFSLRDKVQYRTDGDDFFIMESYWQQAYRLNLTKEEPVWEEHPVVSPAGTETYPHPGKVWQEDEVYIIQDTVFWDWEKLLNVPREDGTFYTPGLGGASTPKVANTDYLVVKQETGNPDTVG